MLTWNLNRKLFQSAIRQLLRIYINVIFIKILTGKPTGKRPLGRPRNRLENNIRMDLKEICIITWYWVDSAHDRDYWRSLVNVPLNFWVP